LVSNSPWLWLGLPIRQLITSMQWQFCRPPTADVKCQAATQPCNGPTGRRAQPGPREREAGSSPTQLTEGSKERYAATVAILLLASILATGCLRGCLRLVSVCAHVHQLLLTVHSVFDRALLAVKRISTSEAAVVACRCARKPHPTSPGSMYHA
jgi:hypothetical protein